MVVLKPAVDVRERDFPTCITEDDSLLADFLLRLFLALLLGVKNLMLTADLVRRKKVT